MLRSSLRFELNPVDLEEGRAIGTFERSGACIRYEEWGQGDPLILLAPSGMRSAISYWKRTPWNPIEHLSDSFRVIAMDQRNAGESRGPSAATMAGIRTRPTSWG